MSASNICLLIGRVGRDPETRTTPNGATVAKFSLAVNRGRKDAQGQWITDWFEVSAWGKAGEKAQERIRKGAKVSVAGQVQIDQWTDQNGTKRSTTVLSADSVEILTAAENHDEPAPTGTQPRYQPPAAPAPTSFIDDDDIPPF